MHKAKLRLIKEKDIKKLNQIKSNQIKSNHRRAEESSLVYLFIGGASSEQTAKTPVRACTVQFSKYSKVQRRGSVVWCGVVCDI